MRKQLCNCDFFFACLSKLGPELGDASANVDIVFLQRMQDTRATDSLGRRPD